MLHHKRDAYATNHACKECRLFSVILLDSTICAERRRTKSESTESAGQQDGCRRPLRPCNAELIVENDGDIDRQTGFLPEGICPDSIRTPVATKTRKPRKPDTRLSHPRKTGHPTLSRAVSPPSYRESDEDAADALQCEPGVLETVQGRGRRRRWAGDGSVQRERRQLQAAFDTPRCDAARCDAWAARSVGPLSAA